MTDRLEHDEEELRRARIARRRAQMRREKERKRKLRRKIRAWVNLLTAVVCVVVLILAMRAILPKTPQTSDRKNVANPPVETVSTGIANVDDTIGEAVLTLTAKGEKVMVGDKEFWAGYEAVTVADTTAIFNEEVASTNAILINASTGEIVANRDAMTRINPASMTKILTVLVAAEQIQNLDEEVTITFEMTDYAYVNDCSVAGFEVDEKVPVRDLFYGTILPSGGEAAMALAIHVAGSQEAFMELMNKKLEELGLADTANFTNCVGLYDSNHYCTTYDMAIIMKAALENQICREALTARTYQTTATTEHPEGLLLSNWFIRRIEDKDCGGEVLGAKTGYVNEAGSCAASYGLAPSGTPYICVTVNANSSWRCIYDHVEVYSSYAK
ncbi:MAG: D-alanyl-D-alanine carboxypeptidase [Lachnospiraceae bacterium]|nr:D-alanyl-D-alanine carboxypeptidase [Lachnospiraceae bacterium]